MASKFYLKGEFNRPDELRRLPLQLYRAQKYPGDPAFVGEQAQQYLDGAEPPIYVPRDMMYTRWTRPLDVFGANTVAMLAALKQSRAFPEQMHAASLEGLPAYGWLGYGQRITGNHLPSLDRLSQQDYSRQPLARNALPIGGFLSADELHAAVKQQQPIP